MSCMLIVVNIKIYKLHLAQIAYDLENNVQTYDHKNELIKLHNIQNKKGL